MTLVVFVCAVVLVATLVFSGGSGYKYTLNFENVSLMVPGNLVMVGGHPVGSIKSIELTEDNQAAMEVELDDPLREGSSFIVRKSSLSSVHNHYLSLTPGPDNAPLLAEGTTLGEANTTSAVEIDQFFDTFDEETRKGWSNLIQGVASIYAGDAAEGANRTFKYSGASFSSTQRLMAELSDQDAKLDQFVRNTGGLMTTLAEVSPTLTELVSNANTALGAIASENESLSLALQELPPTLRQGNTTFVNLRAALDDVEPLLAANERAADAGLAGFLRNDVTPVLRRLKPVAANLATTASRPGPSNDTNELLAALIPLQSTARPAVTAVVRALNASQEELSETRAYAPDIFNAFSQARRCVGQLRRQRPLRPGAAHGDRSLTAERHHDRAGRHRDLRRPRPDQRHQPLPGRLDPADRRLQPLP